MAPTRLPGSGRSTPNGTTFAALANAIDAGNAALAVQLVANHHQGLGASLSPVGEVFPVPAARPRHDRSFHQPGYARVLMVAAWQAGMECGV